MDPLNYIPEDGYTEQGYIAGEPRLYGPLRFEFRPVITEVRSKHLESRDTLPADAFVQRTAALMAQQLVSWNHVDRQNRPLPINARTIGRLKPNLFHRLSMVIMGTQASDVDPEATDAVVDSGQGTYESAMTPAEREASDLKN